MAESTITYDPNWQTEYLEMVMTPEAAVAEIHPGKRIFIGTGCAQDPGIRCRFRNLDAHSFKIRGAAVIH